MTLAEMTRHAASSEDRAELRAKKDISHANTHVVTAPSGKVRAERLNLLEVTGIAFGWMAEFFMTTGSALVRPAIAQNESAKRISTLWLEVDEMQSLNADWNGYGSEAPNDFARDLAKQVLLSATRFTTVPTRVAPSAQGGVGICFYKGNKYGDIECLNNGAILATLSDGVSRPQVWEVSPTESRRALERIVQFINA